ncbi:hypothetical protein SISSUDRAFT_994395 [Sistotremastrum suecicum HHB10207 ss-3]|uniref:Uncharacterized protein n=1 Tax=Sistotremastrum suecicum HHB10207 ss-3 TaxID=1314776 RepID=A0A165XE59_9AGAM|nr:hypothetical protein SISSUDRAFT_994395 [Sistotremastrum suecicum HHB10207 ss-3]
MGKSSRRRRLLLSFQHYVILRDLISPPEDYEVYSQLLLSDLVLCFRILNTRYLSARTRIPKSGNLHLAWHYAQSPQDLDRFVQMLRVTPDTFQHLLNLINDHPIFVSHSNNSQTPVETQLAVLLYRAGRYGNGSSVPDVAPIRKPTTGEREVEKCWVEAETGCPSMRDGWLTGDGTLVVLYQKPGKDGEAYFSRKMNYALNVLVSFLLLLISCEVDVFAGH